MNQEPQSPVRDLGFGVDIALSAMLAVNRTVQIWSRCPGTTGTWYFALYFVGGSILQSWYCEMNRLASNSSDLIPQAFVAVASLLWFCVHGVLHTFQLARGRTFHSYDPGSPVLGRLFPAWSEESASLGSDLIVAMLLSIAFLILQSPILSGWYAAMTMWLVVTHTWITFRDARRRQIWIDSQFEAEYWSDHLKGKEER